jgi:hypothetical protein
VSTTFEHRRAAAVAFLVEHGADRTPHVFGDLLLHLTGVEDLVRAWGGSDLLALVALGHATYGTDGFEPHILELSERAVLAETIGPEAEDLVYFYASCDRAAFYPQLQDAGSEFGDLTFVDRFTGIERVPSPDYVIRFVDLTYANEAELAASSPGGPAEWTWLAEFCRLTRRWATPDFFTGAAALLEMEGPGPGSNVTAEPVR